MSVIGFVKGLVPNFDRTRILEDIGQQKEYLNDTVIPSLRGASKVLSGENLNSDIGREFMGLFKHALPDYRSRGLFQGLADYFGKIAAAVQLIENQVPDLFGADVTAESMTYQKAAILKYLESSRFLSQYTVRAVSQILAAETATALKKDEKSRMDEQFTKWEKSWVATNRQRFSDTLRALDRKPNEIISAVNSIPEITVDENKEKILGQTMGLNKLDPLRLGFLPPALSPIYTIRMYIAEWQHDTYKAGVEEARILQLRILELKAALDGKEDARTQKVLDYNKGRLDALTAKLQEYEEQGS